MTSESTAGWWTADDLAAYLSTSAAAVTAFRYGPPFVDVDGHRWYRPEDVEAWLDWPTG